MARSLRRRARLGSDSLIWSGPVFPGSGLARAAHANPRMEADVVESAQVEASLGELK
jgi:hypothetical protein